MSTRGLIAVNVLHQYSSFPGYLGNTLLLQLLQAGGDLRGVVQRWLRDAGRVDRASRRRARRRGPCLVRFPAAACFRYEVSPLELGRAISVAAAREIDPSFEVGDTIGTEAPMPALHWLVLEWIRGPQLPS